MAATDDTKKVRTSKSSTTALHARAYPKDRRARSLSPLLEPTPSPESPTSRAQDGVGIALTLGALCALVWVLAMYIVTPAITTLADPSVSSWSGEGP